MATKEQHDAALERWMKYERECQLANTAHWTFDPPSVPPNDRYPSIAYPREELLRFRSAYVLLRNAVADFLDLDPETMTELQVILAIAQRHWHERRALDDDDE